jgi:hypothetical protein
MAAIERGLDTFESWKSDLFKRNNYDEINKAAYEAAVWLEERFSDVHGKDWTTLNNLTSLLCSMAVHYPKEDPK